MLHHKPLVCCQWYFESECWSSLGNYTKAEPDHNIFQKQAFLFHGLWGSWLVFCLPACLQVETLHSVHQPVMSLVRKLVPLSSFSTRAWSSQSAFCHGLQAHFWVYSLCNPFLSTWWALATCQRPCLAMALRPSVLPSHIHSAWVFQPGLSNAEATSRLVMDLWRDRDLLLLLSKIGWIMSALLRSTSLHAFSSFHYIFHKYWYHIHNSTPAPQWVLEFPMVLHFCDFLPWNGLGQGAVNTGSCSGPSLCRDLRYWLYFVFNCQHPFLFEINSVEICYVFSVCSQIYASLLTWCSRPGISSFAFILLKTKVHVS